uniref:ribosomal protein S18 n=1 Tax=Hypnea pseudomusciformis TaxID=1545697 RepID=UPI0027D9DFC5|nr:ribosomal protein S18 [Hypnea pseudomusciformis]YP_010903874.1 ribosomal protein S18 [Hypnea musciformis]WCH55132.1 ribosomal protein S18 [Hypnea pseudomusciformis]WCH55531.1 ribosomal protein S18 [Hypnea pseudomusciformis]WCH56725.1 ribosomal protein S18 [Hypnea pseudomusciformis]WCH56925.1 ribosomal protein S18 [Hypnea musciformis]WCH57125.1 ribosomal protein S18 [Hypnea musciformis]
MILYNKKPALITKNEDLNYKDIDLLRKFITDQGKILSRRSTGLTAKQQKKLTKSIKKARILALLPFLNKD